MMSYYLQTDEPDGGPQADGWLQTHDLAIRHADDTISILGRSDEMIIRGGRKIAPAEIEAVVQSVDAVADVAVAGIRNQDGEDDICAWIVLRDQAENTPAQLRKAIVEKSASCPMPQYIRLVSRLPRTRDGKVMRRTLIDEELLRHSRKAQSLASILRAKEGSGPAAG